MHEPNDLEDMHLGKCFQMCPTSEWKLREKHRRLHPFEIYNDGPSVKNSSPKADPSRCVKEFTRAAAGVAFAKLKDIRPPSVLLTTVEYLFREILTRQDYPWCALYEFVFDRLRAVRQDMVVQSVWLPECVTTYENIIRFHIYSIYRLCEEPMSVFDPHINGTHLQECMKRLLVWYYHSDVQTVTRCEMEAYYLLFNLNSTDAARHCLTLPASVRCEPIFQLAFEVYLAWLNKNYVRFFRKITRLPFLCCAATMPHISSIRRASIYAMNGAHSAKNCKFPSSVLKKALLFDTDLEAEEACHYYGIKVDQSFLCFSKASFDLEKSIIPIRKYGFMNEKHKFSSHPSFLLNDS